MTGGLKCGFNVDGIETVGERGQGSEETLSSEVVFVEAGVDALECADVFSGDGAEESQVLGFLLPSA